MKNIILIGMPGTGKSTVGRALADRLGYDFVDVDDLITQATGRTLPEILRTEGLDAFLTIEGRVGETLDRENTVVATGGSMVLSEGAMAHLKENGVAVWLETPLSQITDRMPEDLVDRGIAAPQGMTIQEIYEQRTPLYARYADLIVASRDRFLPAGESVRLGNRVYQIGTEQLRLNHTELSIYARRCGAGLSDAQVDSLLYSSEGWFSAVYLNLRTLSERGVLPDRNSDIYAIFTAAMIDPLPEKQREFLAVMGLADEFTVEMARFVTEDADAEKLLAVLTAQNAFVTCLPDGVTYRFTT